MLKVPLQFLQRQVASRRFHESQTGQTLSPFVKNSVRKQHNLNIKKSKK